MTRFTLPDKTRLYAAATLAAIALAFVLVPDVLAADDFGLGKSSAGTGLPTTTSVSAIVGGVLRVALRLVGTLFLLLMVYAGFLWMTARGDSKKVDTAKQLISAAIIGLLIIASAYAITSFVLTSVTGGTAANQGAGDAGGEKKAAGASCVDNEECASGVCAGDASGTCGDDSSPCANDTDCTAGVTCTGGGGYTCRD